MTAPTGAVGVGTTDTRFSLRLLGPPGFADFRNVPVAGLGPGKPLAMLAYLAVRGEARRDELIDLLWGGVPESRARNAFRQSLHRLRAALGEEFLPLDRERVALKTDGGVRIDRNVFLKACEANRWADAVAVYGGEFLNAFDLGEPAFEEWADNERMRLRARYEHALRNATQQALDTGALLAASKFADALSTVAPFDEVAATLEATVLVASGRQAEALAGLKRFSARLRAEMELPVPAAIRDLAARLERNSRHQSPIGVEAIARRGSPSLPFQGRADELARLLSASRELSAQKGAVFLIHGPAGMGKTRLVDEFADRIVSMEDMLFVRGRERTGGGAIPYASVAEALRGLVAAPGVAGTSRHLLTEAARILPELRDLFDLDAPGPVADEGGKLRFFEGVAALIDSAAYEQPVCFVLDDLHNASSATLDLVGYLASRLQSSPVLILLLARLDSAPSATGDRLRDIASRAGGGPSDRGVIALAPLSIAETEAVVRSCIDAADISTSVDVRRLAQLSAGRPLIAIDLARRALEGGLPSDLPLPIRDIMWSRLQGGSPAQRRVFFAAALLQRSASLRLLASAAHLPESATFDAALQLERLGLFARSGAGFIAAHDVTLSFVLESSGVAGRALLASWAADALAQEPGAPDGELAHLYALAGRPDLAFRHARLAAFSAAAAGAPADAARLASAALTFAPDERARRDIETLLAALGGRDYSLLITDGSDDDVDVAVDTLDDYAAADGEWPEVGRESGERIAEAPHASAAPAAGPPVAGIRATAAPATPAPKRATRRAWWIAAVGSLVIAGAVVQRQAARRPGLHFLLDSVLVSERGAGRNGRLQLATGALDAGAVTLLPAAPAGPPWIDSLAPPLLNPSLAPDGRAVSVERVSSSGTDLFAIMLPRRDTLRLTTGGGDDIALGWAPDGHALLVSRARALADGSYDADLFVYGVRPLVVVPIDTASDRAVTEAAWSPNGNLIAWVARVGPDRQQEVFVSRPDGSERRNISANPGDDSQISWSPDGTLVAFTSNRNGVNHVYTYDLEARRLWTVTSGAGESHPIFAPDGRFLAFESTRDGDAAVYVTLPLGGSAYRVTPKGRQFSLAGWHGVAAPYVERLRIVSPGAAEVGDTVSMGALAVDQTGAALPAPDVRWTILDSAFARIANTASNPPVDRASSLRVLALRKGTARVVVQVPGWRADTLALQLGRADPNELADDFAAGVRTDAWSSLGKPLPSVSRAPSNATGKALYPNADREWQSGVLSRGVFDLRQPVSVKVRMFAPFGGRPIPAAALQFSLVPASSEQPPDPVAPQFSPLVSVLWNGESDRMIYSVGRESFSEASNQLTAGVAHDVEIAIDSSGAVAFSVDGTLRWRSALRFVGDAADLRAKVWLGGRATGALGAFADVQLRRPGRAPH